MNRFHKFLMIITGIAMFHLFLVVIFGDNGLVELGRMRAAHDTLVQENDRLTRENLSMYRTVDRLRNDPTYIENVARRELGMVRADEVIFKFNREEK